MPSSLPGGLRSCSCAGHLARQPRRIREPRRALPPGQKRPGCAALDLLAGFGAIDLDRQLHQPLLSSFQD